MDAVFPGDAHFSDLAPNDFIPGSIFAKRLPDHPVFRVYAWASAIVDGQIVATDYAPDFGWMELDLTKGPNG
jgi:hypothetical protein